MGISKGTKWCGECRSWRPRHSYCVHLRAKVAADHERHTLYVDGCEPCEREMMDRG